MKTNCSSCGQSYDVEPSDAGNLATCEKCGKDFTIQPARVEIKAAPPPVPPSVPPARKSAGLQNLIIPAIILVPIFSYVIMSGGGQNQKPEQTAPPAAPPVRSVAPIAT
jgi:PHP family Zn ribbon phosphoesterase